VARRTNEIGIRMALGAARRRLLWMVLREVLAMAFLGLAIGLPAALVTTRFVQSFLFQMKPNDLIALAAAAVALLAASVLAGYGPAWRAPASIRGPPSATNRAIACRAAWHGARLKRALSSDIGSYS
jgi:ABC-type lipoprotein release transport system permease subunit